MVVGPNTAAVVGDPETAVDAAVVEREVVSVSTCPAAVGEDFDEVEEVV